MSKIKTENEKLVIAISSRALFNLIESHQIYVGEVIETYCDYQISRKDNPLEPGVAFDLVKKLLTLNNKKSLGFTRYIRQNSSESKTNIHIASIALNDLSLVRQQLNEIVSVSREFI